MVRQLIDRRRRKIIPGLERFQQIPAVKHRTQVVYRRIALINADRISPVPLLNNPEPLGYLIENRHIRAALAQALKEVPPVFRIAYLR